MWFDERTEANAIAAKSKYDDIYDATIAAFKRQRASLTSQATQTATDARENEKPCPWIRTAERAPCKEDGDDHNHVLAWKDYMGVQQIHYSFVAENGWPFWMPIPPVPEGKNEPS